jgi:hypothetical protein
VLGCKFDFTQSSTSEKSPLAAMLEIVRAVVPLFVTVTACGALATPTCWNPNARLDVDSVTVEVLPDKFTTCGLPGALSAIVSDALRSPVSEGVNDTVIVHVAPTASEAPHVFVSVKSLELAPEIVMPEIV